MPRLVCSHATWLGPPHPQTAPWAAPCCWCISLPSQFLCVGLTCNGSAPAPCLPPHPGSCCRHARHGWHGGNDGRHGRHGGGSGRVRRRRRRRRRARRLRRCQLAVGVCRGPRSQCHAALADWQHTCLSCQLPGASFRPVEAFGSVWSACSQRCPPAWRCSAGAYKFDDMGGSSDDDDVPPLVPPEEGGYGGGGGFGGAGVPYTPAGAAGGAAYDSDDDDDGPPGAGSGGGVECRGQARVCARVWWAGEADGSRHGHAVLAAAGGVLAAAWCCRAAGSATRLLPPPPATHLPPCLPAPCAALEEVQDAAPGGYGAGGFGAGAGGFGTGAGKFGGAGGVGGFGKPAAAAFDAGDDSDDDEPPGERGGRRPALVRAPYAARWHCSAVCKRHMPAERDCRVLPCQPPVTDVSAAAGLD